MQFGNRFQIDITYADEADEEGEGRVALYRCRVPEKKNFMGKLKNMGKK